MKIVLNLDTRQVVSDFVGTITRSGIINATSQDTLSLEGIHGARRRSPEHGRAVDPIPDWLKPAT